MGIFYVMIRIYVRGGNSMITVTRISKGKGPFYQVELSEGDSLKVSEANEQKKAILLSV